jgi:predicted nucleic acid-binding protein
MIDLVVDTNVLVALLDGADRWHLTAVALHDALQSTEARILYLDCVINETIGVLGRRVREQGRTYQFGELLSHLSTLIPETQITWAYPEVPRLYADVLDIVRSSSGELNFHDALIALICRQLGVRYLAGFDRDFDQVSWLERIEKPTDLQAVLQKREKETANG